MRKVVTVKFNAFEDILAIRCCGEYVRLKYGVSNFTICPEELRMGRSYD
jgi:hypothetical protein